MNLLKALYSILPQAKKFYGELASKSNGKIVVSLVGGGSISYGGESDIAEGSKVWLMIDSEGNYSISPAPDFDFYELTV